MAGLRARVALLIDADNAPAGAIDDVLDALSEYGETNIRRAYGNWDRTNLKQWKDVLHQRAIRPVQQYDYSRGKNASDMALVIDAMALLYTDQPDAFAIVSSDADFTPLVMHLREKGAAVYGFGEEKTPKPFVSACSRFVRVDQLAAKADPAAEADTLARPRLRRSTAELRQDTGLVNLLRNAVNGSADESGWAGVAAVGQHISNQSSFDSRNYGYPSLSKLLIATELFEVRNDGTPAVAVRDPRRTRSSNA